MDSTLAKLLAEASDPTTPSTRLRAISQLQNASERTAIRQALAANPNLDEELLWELAIEFPAAVADNPGLQLNQLREPAWWTQCGTGALLSLLSVMREKAPEQARSFLFEQIATDLISDCKLQVCGEYSCSISRDITVEWQHEWDSKPETSVLSHATDSASEDFILHFKCLGDYIGSIALMRKPETSAKLCDALESLLPSQQGALDWDTLSRCGWEEIDFGMDDAYWELDHHEPNLPDWEFDAELMNDYGGTVTVNDPTGCSHVIPVPPGDTDFVKSNPVPEFDLSQVLSVQYPEPQLIIKRLRAAFLLE